MLKYVKNSGVYAFPEGFLDQPLYDWVTFSPMLHFRNQSFRCGRFPENRIVHRHIQFVFRNVLHKGGPATYAANCERQPDASDFLVIVEVSRVK